MSRDVIGFDGTGAGFGTACDAVGDTSSVVRRDLLVTGPGSETYVYDEC